MTPEQEKALPRGIRNCNPGNLRPLGSGTWMGQKGQDSKGFLTFRNASFGIRALGIDLVVAMVRDGFNTVETLIAHYAPPEFNDTASYVEYVCGVLNTRSDYPIGPAVDLFGLVLAIIHYENGNQPYSLKTVALALADAYAEIETLRDSSG